MTGFRLGSIFGFEIRIDLSWLLIFFLILWTLSAQLFPFNYPGLSGSTYLVMGITGTLLFFASLLFHEISHSLVARAKGIPVEGITLFAFGGVSRTRMDAETPGDEFQIAGVGPLASLVLAALFGMIWTVGYNAGWSVAVTGVVAYLSGINIILAVFNLLPGFPLDGGRLFRSIIWKVTNNLQLATRIATIGGKLLGYLLIFYGLWQLFNPIPNFIGGLWTILIGWFLNNAAEASYQDLLIRTALEGARAREVMTIKPETVPANLNLQELIDQYFFNRTYQSFPVMEDSHLVGMVTLNEVKQVPREEWSQRLVKETMIPAQQDITVRPDEDMTRVLEKMRDTRSRRLLVTHDGNLEGIISATDIANWLQWRREFGEELPRRQTITDQQAREIQSSHT